jgi:type I restriction enzyme M protein
MTWIAPTERATDNAALEKRLWDAAEQAVPAPISGLKSQEYAGGRPQGSVLGLIFLRFAEVRFAAQRAKLESPSPFGGERAGVRGAGHPRPSDGRGAGGEGAPRVSRRGSRVGEPAANHAEAILYTNVFNKLT